MKIPLGGLCLIAMLSLSACGFSLRSNDAVADRFPVLQLYLQQPNSELGRLVRRGLDNANVEVIELDDQTSSPESPVLSVSVESISMTPVTVTPRARAAQYDMRMSLQALLVDDETVLFGPETFAIQQVYYEDTESITGNLEEVTVIQSEMRQELVNRLLRRLEAI